MTVDWAESGGLRSGVKLKRIFVCSSAFQLRLITIKATTFTEMLTIENIPCCLFFSILDAWLNTRDLATYDASVTNHRQRATYLKTLLSGKALKHQFFELTDDSLRWMSQRRLPNATLRADMPCLQHLFSAGNAHPLDTTFVTTLLISSSHRIPCSSGKRLKDILRSFPKLTSLVLQGNASYANGHASKHLTGFQHDMYVLAECKALRKVKFDRVELLTDQCLLTLAAHCPLTSIILESCPRISAIGVKQCMETARSLQEVTWVAWEAVPEPPQTITAQGKGTSALQHLTLVGTGFSKATILALVCAAKGLCSVTISHAGALSEEDIGSLLARHGAHLTSILLHGCTCISDVTFLSVMHCKADKLKTLRLHSDQHQRARAAANLQPAAAMLASRGAQDPPGQPVTLTALTILLTKFMGLQQLQLSGMPGLDDAAVAVICKQCPHLKKLVLHHNHLTNEVFRLLLAYKGRKVSIQLSRASLQNNEDDVQKELAEQLEWI